MRHILTEESYFKMFIELLKTTLSNNNDTTKGEDNEDTTNNSRDTDSDNALQ